jgi:regulation of enolase protein 1 (concanavalin A-like superfamily)
VIVTPTAVKGVAFQRRTATGGTSVHTAGPALAAPIWVKLVRRGDEVAAFYRKNITDGWTPIGRQVFANLSFGLEVMLVVSSHVDGRLASATFDRVAVDQPSFIRSRDIGATTPGTTTDDGATVTMEAGGADIWGVSDGFRFHSALVAADGSVTVRVRSLENTHVWAKAGVMLREGDDPRAAHVMAIATPGRGISLQYRSTLGGLSAEAARRPGTAPEWLRLTRTGDTFTAEFSDNGVTWTTLGSVTIPMFTILEAGLAVTSHVPGTLATAVFDDLSIRR